jgi:LSD1 subclass zinc finger protein
MDPIEFHLLRLEQFLYTQARSWDRRAAKRMRAGEICSSCRQPLPQPHTPECKRCALCAASHHVHLTFFHHRGWHCRFFTERWQPLPRRITFSEAASVIETARRGNGFIERVVKEALDRSLKIGRGGILLRLNDKQFLAIGGVLPSITPSAARAEKGEGNKNAR